jgi:antitoxin VapB
MLRKLGTVRARTSGAASNFHDGCSKVESQVHFHHPITGRIMALNIKNPETERLAHLLADATGESLTEAVTQALRERLTAVRRAADREQMIASVESLQEMVRALPVLDTRSPDEILGYDEYGLPR